jgi:predicted transcriptional regulator
MKSVPEMYRIGGSVGLRALRDRAEGRIPSTLAMNRIPDVLFAVRHIKRTKTIKRRNKKKSGKKNSKINRRTVL